MNGTLTVDTAGAGVAVTGATTLAAGSGTITLTGTDAANDVTMGTVDGGQALDITAGGGDVVLGAVGSGTEVISTTISANTIDLQAITSTGAQDYTGSTTLNGTLTVSAAGSGVTVTGTTALAAGGGTITLTGSDAANDVTMGTVDGGQALDITAGGGDVVLGVVGGGIDVASVDITANTIDLQAVTSTGAQDYTGDTTLNGTLTVSVAGSGVTVTGATALAAGGGTITLTGSDAANDVTMDGVTGAQSFTITAGGGDISFSGNIANFGTPVTDVDFTANTISLQDVWSSSDQIYTGDTTLNTSTCFTNGGIIQFNNNIILSGGNSGLFNWGATDADDIVVSGTVNSDVANTNNFTALAQNLGDVTLNGSIGDTIPVNNILVTGDEIVLSGIGNGASGAGGTATISGATSITLNGSDYWTTGAQDYDNGAGYAVVDLGGDSTFSAGGAGFTFNDLYLDHNGWTITLFTDVSCTNLYFFRGTLDLNGNAVSTTNDVAIFGTGYDPDDPFAGGADTDFEFPGKAGFAYDPGAYNADFAALDGSTIQIGRNFYANGDCSFNAAAAPWNLTLDQDPATAATLPWGNPFAVVFNSTVNAQVNTTGGILAACENVTNADLVAEWDHTHPQIDIGDADFLKSISDHEIYVRFTEDVQDSNRAINGAAGGVTFNSLSGPDPFASASYDATDMEVIFDTGGGAVRWNTDATGGDAGDGASRDSQDVSQNRTTDIDIDRSALFDIHGNRIRPVSDATTIDRCKPVLVEIEAGRANSAWPVVDLFDGHNYFDLRYSEPVDVGTLTGGSDFSNIRSSTIFTVPPHDEGDFDSNGVTATLDGFFEYPGDIKTGSRDGTEGVNGLYRTAATPHEVRIYIAGYNDPAHPAPDYIWPGYIWDADNPDGKTVTPIDNPELVDRAAVTQNPVDTTVTCPVTAVGGGWDYEQPYFSIYNIDTADCTTAENYEIITQINVSEQKVERLEFFIEDNPSEEIAAIGGPPCNVDDAIGPHPYGPGGAANHGIRDVTLVATGNEVNGFRIKALGEASFSNAFNDPPLDTGVDNTVFGTLNDQNDPYFSLDLLTTHNWGPRSSLLLTYTTSPDSRITDLAGNLLDDTPPEGIAVVERTAPRIELTLGKVGSAKVYVRFTEASFGGAVDTPAVMDKNDFIYSHGTIEEIEPITTEGNGVIDAWFILSSPLTGNSAIEGSLRVIDDSIWDSVGNEMTDTARYKITDIGLGVAEPVWAAEQIHSSDVLGDESEVLKTFDGTGKLADRDITLEASILASDHTIRPMELYYDVDPPEDVLATSPKDDDESLDLWLPTQIVGFVENANTEARGLSPYRTKGAVRDFLIPSGDPEIETGKDLEFVLRVGDLYCARLTDPDDPRTVAPWSFGIGEFVKQRSGVTILNNVINPTQGEKAILTYELESSGMATVQIFSLDGDIVKILHRGRQGAGTYTYAWDGTNEGGRIVARGIYFVRVVAPNIDEYRKVLVVK
jgi:hypothetical protein